jgi:ABC-type transport system involved in multi-copper enzyme maturation permease subunit
MRWFIGFSIVVVAVAAFSVYVDEQDLWFPLAALVLFFWIVLGCWAIVLFCIELVRRQWRSAVASLALPIAVFAGTWVIMQIFRDARIQAQFASMRHYYDSQIAELPNDGLRFEEFNWGGMSFASDGVVYDETDEIGRASGHQSAAWVARMRNTDLMCGERTFSSPVRPLGNHYYWTTFGC